MIPTREKIAYALAAVILIVCLAILVAPAFASGGPVVNDYDADWQAMVRTQ